MMLFVALSAVLPLCGQTSFPLTERVRILHERYRDLLPVQPNRTLYLDIMEPIVRMAAEWVDDQGAVIDPVYKQEWGQTTSRFVSSAAVLIPFGRCRGQRPDARIHAPAGNFGKSRLVPDVEIG